MNDKKKRKILDNMIGRINSIAINLDSIWVDIRLLYSQLDGIKDEKTMDDKTLTALKASIEHWEDIKKDPDITPSSGNCPLCRLFDGCHTQCPAYITGHGYCTGTPYEEYAYYMLSLEHEHVNKNEKLRQEIAQKEIDFLISLLPKEGGKC